MNDPADADFIELLEPTFKRKMHMMIKELESQVILCNESTKEWDKTGEDAEKEIKEHFTQCLRALAERKAVLLKEVAYRVAIQKKKLEDIRVILKETIAECHKALDTESFYEAPPDILAVPQNNFAVSRISPELPDILLQNIETHGSVILREKPRFSSEVVTFAGSKQGLADGKGIKSKFYQLRGMCWNSNDNCLYVCDKGNNAIRKITMQGDVSTFVPASKGLNSPHGIVINQRENTFFVVNNGNHTISKINSSGEVFAFAGKGKEIYKDGVGRKAGFRSLMDITIDQRTGSLFVSDQHAIRKISPKGEVTTLAGSQVWGYCDGNAREAKFLNVWGLFYDEISQSVLVCEEGNNKIRRVTMNGDVSTLCEIVKPSYITIAPNRSILVSSHYGCKLYKITEQVTGKCEVVVLAGSGRAAVEDGHVGECSFYSPNGITLHPLSPSLTCFVAEHKGCVIRKVCVI